MTAHEEPTAPRDHELPEKKQTALGLYATSARGLRDVEG